MSNHRVQIPALSFVYVASNSLMPGIVKIGYTARTPGERMAELDTTGVPIPFDIAYVVCVDDAAGLERRAHDLLAEHRIRPGREFFYRSISEAQDALIKIVKEEAIEVFFERGRLLHDEPVADLLLAEVVKEDAIDRCLECEHVGSLGNEVVASQTPRPTEFELLEAFFSGLQSMQPELISNTFLALFDGDGRQLVLGQTLPQRYWHTYDAFLASVTPAITAQIDGALMSKLATYGDLYHWAQSKNMFGWIWIFFKCPLAAEFVSNKMVASARNMGELCKVAMFLHENGRQADALVHLQKALPHASAIHRCDLEKHWLWDRIDNKALIEAFFVITHSICLDLGSLSRWPTYIEFLELLVDKNRYMIHEDHWEHEALGAAVSIATGNPTPNSLNDFERFYERFFCNAKGPPDPIGWFAAGVPSGCRLAQADDLRMMGLTSVI